MKKCLQFSFFMCLFLIGTTSHAQITMGVRAGVNVANYNFKFGASTPSSQQPNFDNIAVLTIGVPVEIMISKHFAIQAELNFNQKGFGSKSSTSGSSGSTSFSFSSEGKVIIDWLELPILAKAKFGTENGVNGGLFLGPSFGYGLSGKSKGTSTSTINGVTTTSSNSETLNFKDDEHSRVDVGVNIGGELTYHNLFFDARYQLGVTNMFTGDNASNGDVNATTRGLALTVGYRFLVSK